MIIIIENLLDDIKLIKTKDSYMIKNSNGNIMSKLNYYDYNINNFDWILVANLDTYPKYRKQGLATKLLNTVYKDMSKQNKGIYLSVAVNNTRAIRLYKELGFKFIKTYESDNSKYIIMAKGNTDINQLYDMNFA